MNRLLPLLVGIAIIIGAQRWMAPPGGAPQARATQPTTSAQATQGTQGAIARAFRSHAENVAVRGSGEVIAVLDDDLRGSRHQRFILRVPDGHTVLVAHNIDLAPRIPTLRRGDRVRFKGVYEWNAKGGVVHWTHRDPAGRHAGGWLEHEGARYE